MTREFLFVVAWMFCSGSGMAQVLGFSLAEGKKKVQIPIEIYNNLVVVPVFLNGALPLKFVIDTGVRTAILTQKSFTDILNLPYSRKYTISGPGGARLVDAYLGTDVHGILGYELFSRFIVDINYDKKMMTLILPERFRPKRKFQTIPIRVEDTKPYITAQVVLNDQTQLTAKLLVDSGASHGLLLEPSSDTRIVPPVNYVSSSIGRGLGGDITGKVGRISSITIGTYKFSNIVTRFPDPNSYFDSLKLGSTPRNGAIGGEVLSRMHVIFNFPKEEMYIKRASEFRKGFHFNLSGLTVKAKGSALSTFEITDVRELSAGHKAGVEAGDIVLSINGIEAINLTLSDINGFFNFKPRKLIRLEIRRGARVLKTRFRLEDEI
jgi:hypothetical protein